MQNFIFAYNENSQGYPSSYDPSLYNNNSGNSNDSNSNSNSNSNSSSSSSSNDSTNSSSSSSSPNTSSDNSNNSNNNEEAEREAFERKNAKLLSQAQELETQLNEQEESNNDETLPPGTTESIDVKTRKLNERISFLQEESSRYKQTSITKKEENIEDSQNMLNTENSKLDGDPVRLTQGNYEQEETDISTGTNLIFEIRRKYSSASKILSSFGFGWSTNIDERIMLGIDSSTNNIEQSYIDCIEEIENIIKAIRTHIYNTYEVSSIENASTELSERIAQNVSNLNEVKKTLNDLKALKISAEFYPAKNTIETIEERAEQLQNAIEQKLQKLEELNNNLIADLAFLNTFLKQYEIENNELSEFRKSNSKTATRKGLNKYTRFSYTPSCCVETGTDTLTLIDENGYPHLLYETADESGIWKNNSERKIIECIKTDTGYKILYTDGIEKQFDTYGLLIKITDRNNNYIIINRNGEEKISSIQTSSGENYSFTYEGALISNIKNNRDATESISYFYNKDKLLYKVCDTDGDIITMEYDSNKRMIAVNKCDGSNVKITYGQTTYDGKALTTETTDEENNCESFIYDIKERKTIYKNHDDDQTIYYYDQNHRIIREIQPDGTVIINEYDDAGNLTKTTENGNTTCYQYDSLGNKERVEYSDGSYETYSYDTYNLLTSYRDRDGTIYEYNRDKNGNLIEYTCGGKLVYKQTFNNKGYVTRKIVYGGNNITTDYEYDNFGNLSSETTGGTKIAYEYDNRNRLKKITKTKQVLCTINYDGKKTIRNDYNGLETTYTKNGRKDLIQITQKDTITGTIHQTRIEYDKRHLPIRVFTGDAENEQLTSAYVYTKEGKIKAQITIKDDESVIRLYDYNKGQISKITQFMAGVIEEPITEQSLNSLFESKSNDFYSYQFSYEIKAKNETLITRTDRNGNTALFEYDAWGNLKSHTDENGEITNNIWTNAGRLKKEQSIYGGFYEYNYDAYGNLISAGEENSSTLNATYNADGSIKTLTDRYGNKTVYSYDTKGRLINEKNNSRSIWYDYDNLDRLTIQLVGNTRNKTTAIYFSSYSYSQNDRTITITKADKYRTKYGYDAFGNIISVTDANNNKTLYEYDYLNNLIAAYDSYGNKTSYEYNVFGLIKSVTLPDGAKTEYEYNASGEVIKITDECGILYKATYDTTGRLQTEQSRAEAEKQYEYDKAGRITKISYGENTLEQYSYTENNRSISVKDADNNAYYYNYDKFGRLINEQNRLGLTQTYSYDAEGNLNQQTNFDGTTTKIIYSNDRTKLEIRYPDGTKNYFVYDAIGNIIEAKNENGRTIYEYDKGGYLIYQKDVTSGEEIRFEYDNAGNRIHLYSSNKETVYTYGANNEIKRIYDNLQKVNIQFEYDKNGREILRKLGNGITEHTIYDKAGRITVKIQKNAQNEILWAEGYFYNPDGKRTFTVDNNALVTFYEYDKQGCLDSVYYPYTKEHETLLKNEAETNGLSTNKELSLTRSFSLEEQSAISSRLTEMGSTFAYTLPAMQVFIKESYSYDKKGNRTAKTTSLGTIEYSYDKENRLISTGSGKNQFVTYTYDNNGNLLSEESASKTIKYKYNSQNRLSLCEITDEAQSTYTQTKYAYDSFGRRILVQDFNDTALRTLYDGFSFDIIKQGPSFMNGLFTDIYENNLTKESTGNSASNRYRYLKNDDNNYTSVSTRYFGMRTVFSENNIIFAQVTSEAEKIYFTSDLSGSIRSITNSYGATNQVLSFDAFGSLIQGSLEGTTDLGYLSKPYDPVTKNYNYGYRDYSPATARFTTPDPIRDGYNWFSYCNNDPINFIDLFGLCTTDKGECIIFGRTQGELDPSRTKDAYLCIKNAVEINDLMGKLYSTDYKNVYVCTTFVAEALNITGYDSNDFLPGGQRVVDSVKILKDKLIEPAPGTNPPEGTYIFYHIDNNNTSGHTGIIYFDKKGNATILHNGSDGKGKGAKHQNVNERTRYTPDKSFDTWFSDTNNPVLYKKIGE